MTMSGFRMLGGESDYSQGDGSYHAEDGHFGVHITYNDLYSATVFLSTIYMIGIITSRILHLPSLVGEIFTGIVLGPNVLNIVPIPEAFVLLGELGLILLVVEAGIDMDMSKLKLVGARGFLIALIGTFLPIAIAFGVATLMGYQGVEAITASCSFAPTSLGIAMNVLKQSGIINTPVGQLIVAAAIIDDMLALVILSQLQAFVGEATLANLLIPVFSALGFLLIGGYLALFVLPWVFDYALIRHFPEDGKMSREWISMAIMFTLLLLLIPATYHSRASPLMGAFLAGLVFCSSHKVHHMFESQFKRVMQWLMRIFFAASIGFQVPISHFADKTVVLQGLAFTAALLGKVLVGFLAPNFSSRKCLGSNHLHDCLAVGFSMAAEGEFAFVIAVYGVSNGLISQDLYASVVLAVLLSTILAPFCLRLTIAHFKRKIEAKLLQESDEATSKLESSDVSTNDSHGQSIFYCIQTKSELAWGIQASIVSALNELNLDIIDHRSWHPPHSTVLLVNEVYVNDTELVSMLNTAVEDEQLAERIQQITSKMEHAIHQINAIVRVQRWVPNIHKGDLTSHHIVREAGIAIERSRQTMSKIDLNVDDGSQYIPIDDVAKPTSQQQTKKKDPPAASDLGHLDIRCKGHLEGFFRHERPHFHRMRSLSYDDAAIEMRSVSDCDDSIGGYNYK